MNSTGDLVLVGGTDGVAGVYSISQKQVLQTLKTDGAVSDAIWAGDKAVVGSSTGSVKVFENGNEVASFGSHAGEVTALALHATGDIIASVGVDKSYVLYDLSQNSVITQIFSDSGKCPLNDLTFDPKLIIMQLCCLFISIQMAISWLLVVPMGKSRSLISKPALARRTFRCQVQFKTFSSLRMVLSWLHRLPTRLLFLFGTSVALRRPRCWTPVARSTLYSGTILVSSF